MSIKLLYNRGSSNYIMGTTKTIKIKMKSVSECLYNYNKNQTWEHVLRCMLIQNSVIVLDDFSKKGKFWNQFLRPSNNIIEQIKNHIMEHANYVISREFINGK